MVIPLYGSETARELLDAYQERFRLGEDLDLRLLIAQRRVAQACCRQTCCQQYRRTQRRRLLKPRRKRGIRPPVRPRLVTGTSMDQAARRAPPQDRDDAEEGRLVIEGFSFGTVAARVHPCCPFSYRTRPPEAVTVWNQRCRLPTPHNDDAVRGPINTPATKRGWHHPSTRSPPSVTSGLTRPPEATPCPTVSHLHQSLPAGTWSPITVDGLSDTPTLPAPAQRLSTVMTNPSVVDRSRVVLRWLEALTILLFTIRHRKSAPHGNT